MVGDIRLCLLSVKNIFINLSITASIQIVENLDINPETDSFYYMEILLESLAILRKLPQALEVFFDFVILTIILYIHANIRLVY